MEEFDALDWFVWLCFIFRVLLDLVGISDLYSIMARKSLSSCVCSLVMVVNVVNFLTLGRWVLSEMLQSLVQCSKMAFWVWILSLFIILMCKFGIMLLVPFEWLIFFIINLILDYRLASYIMVLKHLIQCLRSDLFRFFLKWCQNFVSLAYAFLLT